MNRGSVVSIATARPMDRRSEYRKVQELSLLNIVQTGPPNLLYRTRAFSPGVKWQEHEDYQTPTSVEVEKTFYGVDKHKDNFTFTCLRNYAYGGCEIVAKFPGPH
jgi:hypothetical protein